MLFTITGVCFNCIFSHFGDPRVKTIEDFTYYAFGELNSLGGEDIYSTIEATLNAQFGISDAVVERIDIDEAKCCELQFRSKEKFGIYGRHKQSD